MANINIHLVPELAEGFYISCGALMSMMAADYHLHGDLIDKNEKIHDKEDCNKKTFKASKMLIDWLMENRVGKGVSPRGGDFCLAPVGDEIWAIDDDEFTAMFGGYSSLEGTWNDLGGADNYDIRTHRARMLARMKKVLANNEEKGHDDNGVAQEIVEQMSSWGVTQEEEAEAVAFLAS